MLICSITFLFVIYILTHYPIVLNNVLFALDTFKENIFPSLFPMFVLSKILVEYDFIYLVPNGVRNCFSKIFKINSNAIFIFIMAILTGFPSSARYTLDLYNRNYIDNKTANKILLFSHFSNPLFITGTIGIVFLNDKRMGILILVSHYISNILLGLIYRNKYVSNNSTNISLKNKPKSFGLILGDSIASSMDSLLLILGTITMFTIISNILNVNDFSNVLVSGILEMCNGLKKVSLLNVNLLSKGLISCFFISFGGFSVHIQNFAILGDLKINYGTYFISRVLQGIISAFLLIVLYKLFYG